MRNLLCAAAAATTLLAATAQAENQNIPQGTFGSLDHVFLIVMENEDTGTILNNPNAPFINSYRTKVNQATQYYAVGHPSAPNYLEIVGGSNFGLTNDYWPNWVGTGCVDNSGSSGCVNALTPIPASGGPQDNAVPSTVASGGCNGQLSFTGAAAQYNCARYDYAAAPYIGQSIADQLVSRYMSWKAYEESLPSVTSSDSGVPTVFGVNYSDGVFSNLSSNGSDGQQNVFATGTGPIGKLYAVKHNPFAYFENIEEGSNPALSLARVADFDGNNGLWADLQRPLRAPHLFFIVPNQCHDMHGFVSGGTPVCASGGSGNVNNNLLIREGDAALAKIINAIKTSPTWFFGRNAIVVVWDEDDYDNVSNNVVMLVETNYASNGRVSSAVYDHFSLLRTLEAGFGLPCLNHACDSTSVVMDDMFGGN